MPSSIGSLIACPLADSGYRLNQHIFGENVMSRNLAARIAAGAAAVAAVSSFALAAPAGQLTLTSTEAANGKMMAMEQVLNGFGCSGGNVSPGLKWTDAPAGTKSFALTVYDPDAPTGSGW